MLTALCATLAVLALGYVLEVVLGSSGACHDATLGLEGGCGEISRLSPREFLGRSAPVLLSGLAVAIGVAGGTEALIPACAGTMLFLGAHFPRRAPAAFGRPHDR